MSRLKLPHTHIPIGILILGFMFAISLAGVSPQPHAVGATANNGRIVYSSGDITSSNWSIFTANSDGSDIQEVVSDTTQNNQPSYSPDGTKIAYVSQPFASGDDQVMVANSDGTNQIDVSNADGFYNESPVWSPDGTKIAFSRQIDDFSAPTVIYTINADGSNPTAVTDGTNGSNMPSWNNTGTSLSYLCGGQICTINTDGSHKVQLTNISDEFISDSYSPDGTQIAYVTFATGYVQTLGIMNADGSNQHAITSQNPYNENVSWSPDGTKLIYDNYDMTQNVERVYYINLDGTGETVVTPDNVAAFYPSWQPIPGADSDGDGVSTAVEAAGPNGGDANNDGIADKIQANVTSYVNPLTNNYITLASTCNSSSAVSSQALPAAYKDSAFSYPQGLLSFTLACATHGKTATVNQYFYGVATSNTMVLRKYNNVSHAYTTVPGVSITSVTIGGKTATKASYQITDGSSLDQDGATNGVIIDPVGLALPAAGAPNTGLGGSTVLPWTRAAAPSL
jgi:Tol biopolymer transport system component